MTDTDQTNHPTELRDQLGGLMSTDRRLTQAAISREIGVSSSAFNQWLKGVYGGDNAAIESKVQLWVEALQARRAAGDSMPKAPEWFSTPTSVRIISALG